MTRDAHPPAVPPEGELLLYKAPELDAPLQVRLQGNTVWLSQRRMAELYGVTVANINQHIAAIYADKELSPKATIKQYLIVQTEGWQFRLLSALFGANRMRG